MAEDKKHIITIHLSGDGLDDLMDEICEATKAVDGLVLLDKIYDHLQLENEEIKIKLK